MIHSPLPRMRFHPCTGSQSVNTVYNNESGQRCQDDTTLAAGAGMKAHTGWERTVT